MRAHGMGRARQEMQPGARSLVITMLARATVRSLHRRYAPTVFGSVGPPSASTVEQWPMSAVPFGASRPPACCRLTRHRARAGFVGRISAATPRTHPGPGPRVEPRLSPAIVRGQGGVGTLAPASAGGCGPSAVPGLGTVLDDRYCAAITMIRRYPSPPRSPQFLLHSHILRISWQSESNEQLWYACHRRSLPNKAYQSQRPRHRYDTATSHRRRQVRKFPCESSNVTPGEAPGGPATPRV
ncbi:uncharacterized protein C8Q71DRAFT_145013 [Rhodofomes roseus]|uniref:Uncharacterized protein n=1 Tax=Rhodofomes roseus TaxID=34475 RepID=A0ABQ8KAK9_9APHY|nr:uncharacterized protein C8Q71DRAFT_145013 [Rhodofomes roseus]KAH9834500.1 hypothetical protein C8Q71DRAFT_145013 [Rhodofomes roseus]